MPAAPLAQSSLGPEFTYNKSADEPISYSVPYISLIPLAPICALAYNSL